MKPNLLLTRGPILIAIVLLCAAPAWGDTPAQIQHELSHSLVHHTVYIHHAYRGSYLHFDGDGKLLNRVERGYWTETGAVSPTKLEMMASGLLHIEAERMAVAFDRSAGKWNLVHRQQVPVVLEVQLSPSQMTVNAARNTMTKIFAINLAELAPELPDYWLPCVTGVVKRDPTKKGRPFCFSRDVAPDMQSHAPVATNVPREVGSVVPAHTLDAPPPRFTDVAREAQFNGSSVVWLVVDEQGRPAEIYVVSPVGYGLDDEAVNAIARWRFAPARLNGKQIRVQMTVEVNFKVPLRKKKFWQH